MDEIGLSTSSIHKKTSPIDNHDDLKNDTSKTVVQKVRRGNLSALLFVKKF